jgi:hypothetical protein
MCAVLVGGMTRLKKDYVQAAEQWGVRLKVFTGQESKIADRIGNAGLVIIFTNRVSHEGRRQAVLFARSNNIPTRMIHSCSIASLRECLKSDGSGGLGEGPKAKPGESGGRK